MSILHLKRKQNKNEGYFSKRVTCHAKFVVFLCQVYCVVFPKQVYTVLARMSAFIFGNERETSTPSKVMHLRSTPMFSLYRKRIESVAPTMSFLLRFFPFTAKRSNVLISCQETFPATVICAYDS